MHEHTIHTFFFLLYNSITFFFVRCLFLHQYQHSSSFTTSVFRNEAKQLSDETREKTHIHTYHRVVINYKGNNNKCSELSEIALKKIINKENNNTAPTLALCRSPKMPWFFFRWIIVKINIFWVKEKKSYDSFFEFSYASDFMVARVTVTIFICLLFFLHQFLWFPWIFREFLLIIWLLFFHFAWTSHFVRKIQEINAFQSA